MSKLRISQLSLSVFMAASVSTAGTVYVAPDAQSPAAPFDSWATACADLSDAVDYACANGIETVIASNGTYALSRTVSITNAVEVRSVSGAAEAAIDGGDAMRCVVVGDAGAVLSGFTVTRGRLATGDGAGIYVSSGLVEHCIVTRNRADFGFGGGAYLAGGVMDACTVTYNAAEGYNGSGGGGGGLVAASGSEVRSCLVAGNECSGIQAHLGGGGVMAYGSTLANCTIVGNYDREDGTDGAGGVYLFYTGGAVSIVNCIIAGNLSNGTNPGGEIYDRGVGCTASHTYVPGGIGSSRPTGAPVFVSPGSGAGLSMTMGDYRQPFSSPCIRAGEALAWMAGATDAAGEPRIAPTAAVPDIGAFTTPAGVLACYFSLSPSSGLAPLQVAFSATAEGTEAADIDYHWDFDGDDSTDSSSASPEASFTYDAIGSFSPTLAVSNRVTGAFATCVKPRAVTVASTTIYVSTNGTATAPYSTLETAAATIADALAMSADGVTILVGPGTYEITSTIDLSAPIALRSLEGPEETVIDAGGGCRVASISHEGAVISGFTLANGSLATGAGGGAGVAMSAGLLENCVVTGCATHDANGGGASMSGGMADRCVFTRNYAYYLAGGGGVFMTGPAVIRSCLVAGNECTGNQGHIGGGGVYCQFGGTIESCTIVANYDHGSIGDGNDGGGGLYVFGDGAVVRNTIIYGNGADPTTGPDWFSWNGLAITADHVCCPSALGTDAVVAAPRFVADGSGMGIAMTLGDYAPILASPCARAGANQAWMAGALDLAGLPRIDPVVGVADIGAYSLPSSPLDCSYIADVTAHAVPFTVSFEAFTSGTATNDLTYYWDFDGDGATDLYGAGCRTATHVYATVGSFMPVLCVSNSSPVAGSVFHGPVPIIAAPPVLYVSNEGSSVSPFETPQTAASSVAAALAIAGAGSEVRVLPGVYRLSEPVRLAVPARLVGVGGPEETLLDGCGTTRVIEITEAGAVCSGLTITNGWTNTSGGGAIVSAGVLERCLVVGNRADSGSNTGSEGGGGVYVTGSGLVSGCRIERNSSLHVGGGAMLDGGGTLRNCLVVANACDDGGQAHVGGGGILAINGGAVENCTVVGNYDGGSGEGGGYYSFYYGPTVTNSIFFANARADGPCDFYVWNNAACLAAHNLVGTGMERDAQISGDPCFRDPGSGSPGLAFATGDYRLRGDSPCLNIGVALPWMADAPDIAGHPRLVGSAPDLGAYERASGGTALFIR